MMTGHKCLFTLSDKPFFPCSDSHKWAVHGLTFPRVDNGKRKDHNELTREAGRRVPMK
jgi:hypothetical protein